MCGSTGLKGSETCDSLRTWLAGLHFWDVDSDSTKDDDKPTDFCCIRIVVSYGYHTSERPKRTAAHPVRIVEEYQLAESDGGKFRQNSQIQVVVLGVVPCDTDSHSLSLSCCFSNDAL